MMQTLGAISTRCLPVAVAATSLLVTSTPAQAVQHLVAPGESWQERAARLRPGDEIILMPGKHKPGLIEAVEGTAQQPILIRGVDADHRAEIVTEREGLRIRQPRHVIIRDLVITGGSIAGISLGSAAGNPETDVSNVTIKNVTVRLVGPKGQRHGLALVALNTVVVENCRFEGWGGSGIDMVSCHDVKITNCELKGLADYGQLFGIRARTGTRHVQIEQCRFSAAGAIAVCLGGSSNIEDFLPAIPTDAPLGSVAEAAHINVENCLIIDAPCAIAYVNSVDCAVRRNTIIRPRRSTLAILAEQAEGRITPGRHNIFGGNIVAWEPGDLKQYAEITPKADVTTFSLETNLWWSAETAEQRAKITSSSKDQPGVPEIPTARNEPQITTVDPRLDARFGPTEAAAQAFGATLP